MAITNQSHIGGNGTSLTITGTGGSAASTGSAAGVFVGSTVDTVGSEISAIGLITINGTGGTGNNVSATGVAVFGPSGSSSTIESLGGIVINGTGGTVVSGTGPAVGVSLLNAVVRTASPIGDTTPRHISITGHGGTSSGGANWRPGVLSRSQRADRVMRSAVCAACRLQKVRPE